MSINAYPAWVAQILQKAGYPVTTVNQQALYLWASSESSPAMWAQGFNYLDSEGDFGQQRSSANLGFGPGLWNSAGVVTFANQDAGTTATAKLLQSKPGIDAAFRNGKSLKQIFGAIQLSTYCCDATCRNCSGNQYPPKLYQALGMTGGQVAAYLRSLLGTPYAEAGTTSAASSSGSGSSSDGGTGCNEFASGRQDNKVFVIPHTDTGLNRCQLKAVKGALLSAAGVVVMAIGLSAVLKGAIPSPAALASAVPSPASPKAPPAAPPAAPKAPEGPKVSRREYQFRERQAAAVRAGGGGKGQRRRMEQRSGAPPRPVRTPSMSADEDAF